jgi:hypothetical protein
MNAIQYTEKVVNEFRPAPDKGKPYWSIYVAAVMPSGGTYTEGHGYGMNRDEALMMASRDITRKIGNGQDEYPGGQGIWGI